MARHALLSALLALLVVGQGDELAGSQAQLGSGSGDVVSMFQHSLKGSVSNEMEAAIRKHRDEEQDDEEYEEGPEADDTLDEAELVEETTEDEYDDHEVALNADSERELEMAEEQDSLDEDVSADMRISFRLSEAGTINFQEGDKAEVHAMSCIGEEHEPLWAPASIISAGNVPDTYSVRIAVNPPGQQDVPNVPNTVLRSIDGSQRKDFKAGEAVEVQSTKCKEQGSWVQCTITGKGRAEGTWDVQVRDGDSDEFQDLTGVPAKALRRFAQ